MRDWKVTTRRSEFSVSTESIFELTAELDKLIRYPNFFME